MKIDIKLEFKNTRYDKNYVNFINKIVHNIILFM